MSKRTAAAMMPVFDADMCAVMTRFKDLVYRIALSHTRTVCDAQDVFQEVFLTYWRKQPLHNDDEHRKAWLINTTLNCAKHVTSASWSKKVLPFAEISAELQQERSSAYNDEQAFQFASDEQDEIFHAMQSLPTQYRTVLHLFYFEDMAIAQIAEALEINAGTVKVQLTRARSMMRAQLKGAYFNE
jgi:RNA polymerase sigma-70 factor (ECF subfamily)